MIGGEPLRTPPLTNAGLANELVIIGGEEIMGAAKGAVLRMGAALTTVPPIRGGAPPLVTILDFLVVTVVPGANPPSPPAGRDEKDIFNLNLLDLFQRSIALN
jgi:hypothetical protein